MMSRSKAGKYVVFRRDELFQMLGKVAMPPGSGAPHNTDCGDIASKLIEEVEDTRVKFAAIEIVFADDEPEVSPA